MIIDYSTLIKNYSFIRLSIETFPAPLNRKKHEAASITHAAKDFSIASFKCAAIIATVKFIIITIAAGRNHNPIINNMAQINCAYTDRYALSNGAGKFSVVKNPSTSLIGFN